MSDEEKLKLRRKNFIRGTLFAKLWKMNDLQNLVKNSNITKIHSTVFVFKQSHLARSCGYPNILTIKLQHHSIETLELQWQGIIN